MFVKKCLVVAVAAGSMVLGGAGAAFADAAVGSDSHNSESRLSGNNANAAVNAPANVCGNGVGVLGFGTGAADCRNENGSAFAGSSSYNSESRLSGNNANAAVNAPANVCGNGVGVLGFGTGAAGCQTGDNDGNRYDGGKKGKSSSEK